MSTLSSYSAINARYVLNDKIGEGGFGVVYRARDRLTTETIALKRVTIASNDLDFASQSSMTTENINVTLAQEFKTLASLRHPNIISVLDYGFDQNHAPYFTMELLDNASTILEAGKDQSVEKRVGLLVELLQALTYLHRRGILHRDLKPANILVDQQGRVKVLDFGLSTTLEQAKGMEGTLAYMAPEVLQGRSISQASDLFAAGVIGYQLLTGHHPFHDDDVNQMMIDILHAHPDLSSINNDNLAHTIATCLEKDPFARYIYVEEAIHAFNNAMDTPLPLENDAIRESFLQAAQFVGRDDELAQLTDALDDALQGNGSLWLIAGESGVGKSRLLEELRIQALVNGATVVRGQSVEGRGLAYQAWRDPLQRLALTVPLNDMEASIIKTIVPGLSKLLERPIPDAPLLEGQAAQQRLILTIATIFQRSARDIQPIVFLLEDLQWAGENLEPLKAILRQIDTLPLLIIGSYRDDEQPNLPDELPNAHVMQLNRLQPEHIAELSISMLGNAGAQPQILDMLHRETEGNVFFLVETVRALAEEAGQLGDISEIALPESVFTGGMQQIIQRRLQRIPTDDTPLLKLAALIGRELDLIVLQVLSPNTDFETWLTTCANVAVLEVQEDQWRFAHDKLRNAIIDAIPARELPDLHRQIAVALEHAYPDDPNYAARLVTHWHIAGNDARELHHTLIAGEQAFSMSSIYAALDFTRRARTMLPTDDAQQVKLALQAGEALFQVGQYEQASEQLSQGLALAYQYDDLGSCAAVFNHLGAIACTQGDFSRGRECLAQSLIFATAVEDNVRIAQAELELGWIDFRQGKIVDAHEHFSESVRLYEALDHVHGLAFALNRLGGAALHLARYDEAYALRIKSLDLCRQIGNRRGESVALANLGEGARLQAQYDTARQFYLEALDIERTIDAKHLIAITLGNLGKVELACDKIYDALPYLLESAQIAHHIGASLIAIDALSGICAVWAKIGQEMRAIETLGLILNHPAMGDETRPLSEATLKTLRADYHDMIVDAALDRGKKLDLDTVVRETLAEYGMVLP